MGFLLQQRRHRRVSGLSDTSLKGSRGPRAQQFPTQSPLLLPGLQSCPKASRAPPAHLLCPCPPPHPGSIKIRRRNASIAQQSVCVLHLPRAQHLRPLPVPGPHPAPALIILTSVVPVRTTASSSGGRKLKVGGAPGSPRPHLSQPHQPHQPSCSHLISDLCVIACDLWLLRGSRAVNRLFICLSVAAWPPAPWSILPHYRGLLP